MKKISSNWRFKILFILMIGAAVGVSARLFCLQVLEHDAFVALAKDQHDLFQKIIPQRGEIFIQGKNGDWQPLAVNRDYFRVFLSPKGVTDKNAVAQKLSAILGMPVADILEKLKDSDDPYESLQSKLSDEIANQIKEVGLKGVYIDSENWRWYPQGSLASHALGFVGYKNNQRVGQYGLEGYYENELAGQNGSIESEKDAVGRLMLVNDFNMNPAKDGDSLFLTLDQNIQYATEQKLKEVLTKWQSSEGCAIVMEPKTGAIRAIASFPDFNPNEYNKTDNIKIFLDSCTQKLYEPGSVFKPIVMAAGLDSNKITPSTTYTDEGFVQIGSDVIRNANDRSYGLNTMTQVLEKSINTGVIFVQRLIGGEMFKKYIEAFGFSEPTGVDLAGEVAGSLKNIDENHEVNFATAAFGQGISVTPLEMISAVAAIANNGKLMRPYVVEKTVDVKGQEKMTQPEVVRQVISPQAAGNLTAMLVSTVRNGYDKVKIKDYFIAGKTGTAQIPSPDKRGYLGPEETIHTFIGYAPAYNPKFIILLKMDRPRGINFASDSLAPTFSDLASYLLNYYDIPPEN